MGGPNDHDCEPSYFTHKKNLKPEEYACRRGETGFRTVKPRGTPGKNSN